MGEKSTRESFPIVGIGASAGGLEALERFFSNMAPSSNCAFIVIQHLAPKHKSLMGSLLEKRTKMPVVQIEDGMKIDKNHVYLNPPGCHVAVSDATLYLVEPDKTVGPKLPIDFFFRSLSEDQGEKAIGIILSGTGTDGTLGLKDIKSAGGMAMVQEPEQAAYSGMPASAIDTRLVDFIVPAEDMGKRLLKYLSHPYIAVEQKAVNGADTPKIHIQKILALIRSMTGNDFSKYKENTIRRRIERRMAVHQIERIEHYILFLQQTPAEVDTLFKDFLIGVTAFFRDPEAFQALSETVLPQILVKKHPDDLVRVWVPGCAAGEEAYSIAMLLVEAMERFQEGLNVQIFATDIDVEAIDHARAAMYPDNIASDVSAERLNRFFIREEKTYRVKKQIRQMVVFAVQNLIKDPPFSKLDLICCRNLLIYMGPELQKKVLPLFHHSLNPEGYLFLGSSESVGRFGDLFSTLDARWKIFRHKGSLPGKTADFRLPLFPHSAGVSQQLGAKTTNRPADVKRVAEKIILENYAPASVLIDEKLDVLYFFGQTERYLVQPVGEPSVNILRLARKELHYPLSAAIHKAVRQKKTMTSQGVQVKYNHSFETVEILVRPLTEPSAPPGLMMVVFKGIGSVETSDEKKRHSHDSKEIDHRVGQLEQELQYTRENLQIIIEELETSNEELRSVNEEMQSSNEELQSTNEELETSREEMHSTNEELVTVNSELQSKIHELEQVNNDTLNLLASTEIATLFLDDDLCIKGFTPAAKKLFNLIQTDIGRPISDINSNIIYDSLNADCQKVLTELTPVEAELRTKEGAWFGMKMLPYRTVDNVIDGLVITLVEITDRKLAQQREREARIYAENIVDTVREPLVVLTQDMKVISANKSFYSIFHVTKEETEQERFFELGDNQWNIPQLQKLLKEILSEDKYFENFKVEHDFPKIGRKVMLLNGRRVMEHRDKNSMLILLAIEDITQH